MTISKNDILANEEVINQQCLSFLYYMIRQQLRDLFGPNAKKDRINYDQAKQFFKGKQFMKFAQYFQTDAELMRDAILRAIDDDELGAEIFARISRSESKRTYATESRHPKKQKTIKKNKPKSHTPIDSHPDGPKKVRGDITISELLDYRLEHKDE